MKQLLFVLSLFMSFSVFANPVCDFPYDLAEEDGVRELTSMSITKTTRLTRLQKLQVTETARRSLIEAEVQIPARFGITQAIESLSENSEGGDVYLTVFRFKGVVYTIVQYYPGGNPYGYVFKGATVVARRTDGDLLCDGI